MFLWFLICFWFSLKRADSFYSFGRNDLSDLCHQERVGSQILSGFCPLLPSLLLLSLGSCHLHINVSQWPLTLTLDKLSLFHRERRKKILYYGNIGFLIKDCFHYFFFGCCGSSLLCAGFLQLRRAGATLCCGARASHCGGFSCCRAWALGAWASVVAVCGMHVGSSWTRDQTCVPCIGRRILNH